MSNLSFKNILKKILSAYKSSGYPLLSITRLLREPMRYFFSRSPLLRHDSQFYWRPFLLNNLHSWLVVNHPQDFEIYGKKIRFRSYGSLMSVQGYYVGEIEYHLVQYIVKQLKPNFVMYDVGAHHGLYTLIVAYELKSRGWEGVIHSFEPNPTNFSLLAYNIEQNNLSDYVILHNQGVSNTEGKETLMVTVDENSDSRLKEVFDENYAYSSDASQYSLNYDVDVIQIDSMLDDSTPIDLIKMDIQGAEFLALAGAEKTIVRDAPLLIVEAVQHWSSKSKIEEFLKDHNYAIYGIDAQGNLCEVDSPQVFVSWDWVGLPITNF